jgi:hypothetical protein
MLVFRDLGAVQDSWLTTQFVLAYFEGQGISPPVRHSISSVCRLVSTLALQLKAMVQQRLQQIA